MEDYKNHEPEEWDFASKELGIDVGFIPYEHSLVIEQLKKSNPK